MASVSRQTSGAERIRDSRCRIAHQESGLQRYCHHLHDLPGDWFKVPEVHQPSLDLLSECIQPVVGAAGTADLVQIHPHRLGVALHGAQERRLSEDFPYVILDARYERVREAGVSVSQAVLVAVGTDWDGRRQILGVELASRESRSSWTEFLVGLKARGLGGVELVVSDDHAGLTAAIREVLPAA